MAAALLWAAIANAETQFGVTVYPGAKADAAVTRSLREQLKVNGFAYRTSDGLSKVVEFYRKQPLEEAPGTNPKGAGFMGKGLMVTIQNPWMDMTTGKLVNDTLISIVKD
jgi:hypothetical protein